MKYVPSHIGNKRLDGLSEAMRHDLIAMRKGHGWTQAELGRRVGLPQVHISGIETGKVVPRFNTLVELVRVMGYDLLLVPRSLVPAVQSLVRDHQQSGRGHETDVERPLYATNDEGDWRDGS
ncbi:MAG: helix-turn-helix transcriptional regulator [Bryobacteraceae bacterium]